MCADVADYAPPADFDLVVVLYLQLSAPQRSDIHRRAAGGVAPGGALLVVGHDASNLADGYGGPQDPGVLFSPEDVTADIAGSGLVVDKADRVHRMVGTAEGSGWPSTPSYEPVARPSDEHQGTAGVTARVPHRVSLAALGGGGSILAVLTEIDVARLDNAVRPPA